MFKKCRRCGAGNSQQVRVCKNCGSFFEPSKVSDYLMKEDSEGWNPTRIGDLEFSAALEVKRRRKIISGSVAATVCVVGLGLGFFVFDQGSIGQAKKVYASGDVDQLIELKAQMDEEDWQRFERFVLSESQDILERRKRDKITHREALTELEQVQFLLEDSTVSEELNALYEQLEELDRSLEAFRQGEILKAEGQLLKAYRSFSLVSPNSNHYKEALSYQDELKDAAISEWIKEVQQLIEGTKYIEALKELSELNKIAPQNANVLALKAKAERLARENPSAELIEDKSDELPLIQLVSDQVIELDGLKVHFKMARFATQIKPDLIERDPNADKQVIYESAADLKFFDLIFRVTNDSSTTIPLAELMTAAYIETEAGERYDEVTYFYTETPKKLIPMYQWAELKESSETTYRVVIQVPGELDESSVKAYLTIGDQRYELSY